MKCSRSTLVCLLGFLVAGLAARAAAPKATEGFPYQTIIDRNAFHLNPPPPPAPDPATIKPPPPKITLTGIMYLFGTKRALMKVLEPGKSPEPGKPPGPVQEQSYILSEGERQGEVEVLAIDDKAGRVKVDNYGTTMILPLITNMPPAAVPGPVTMPVPGAAAAAAFPGGIANPPVAGNPFTTIGGAGAPPNPAMTTIPTRTLRLPVPAAPPAPQTPQSQTPALSPEEQIILLHAVHEVDPSGPPPPPLPQ